MEFEMVLAGVEQREILRNLMHLYLYDFTEFIGGDVDENGWFEDEHLHRYWSEPGRFPFLLRAGGNWAGFVLVRRVTTPEEQPAIHAIAEFFVMKHYRRKGIGQWAACQAFDRFPGRWWVDVEPENLPAQVFWKKVIGAYAGGKFEEVFDEESGHLRNVFENLREGS